MTSRDVQWDLIGPILPDVARRQDGRGRPWRENRAVLGGILWILRTGAPPKALQAVSRASELGRAAGGNRILAGIAIERARILRAANRTSEAEATLREGVRASRKMGERPMLPRLLAQLADVLRTFEPPYTATYALLCQPGLVSSNGTTDPKKLDTDCDRDGTTAGLCGA